MSVSKLRQHASGSELDTVVIISVINALFSAVQGALEISLPLWILSPVLHGGLGYSPSRSGVSMFCASLVVLWTMRFRASRLVSQIPNKAPMRALRISFGSESVLLALLTLISAKTPYVHTCRSLHRSKAASYLTCSPFSRTNFRSDSIVMMSSLIILSSCLALASMVGRSACSILHETAASRVGESQPKYKRKTLLPVFDSGSWIFPVSEIAGILTVSPLLSWSLTNVRSAPFDGTCVIFATSLLNFALYVGSFSLKMSAASGEYVPCSFESINSSTRQRKCIQFTREIISVSAGDMASLFRESNWSTTPLLGHSRSRAFSDNLEMLEQGEGVNRRFHKAT